MKLSLRESQILNLLQRGMTNKEIGQDLGLSPHTVRDRISAMLLRYEVPGRTALAALHTRKSAVSTAGKSQARADTDRRATGERRTRLAASSLQV